MVWMKRPIPEPPPVTMKVLPCAFIGLSITAGILFKNGTLIDSLMRIGSL
jgi:hypothetical protein